MRNKQNTQIRENQNKKLRQIVPHDVITEILTYLPVKTKMHIDTLVFNNSRSSVCLSACVASQECLHLLQPRQRFERECFKQEPSACGLILETNKYAPSKCRIRNPATRLVLYLPDKQRSDGRIYSLEHVKKSDGNDDDDDIFKVISVWEHDKNGSLGCEVLDIGIDKQWRTLGVSNSHRLGGLWLRSADRVLYFVQFVGDVRFYSCLDLVNDRFHCCPLPPSFVNHPFFPIRWNQNLAFVLDRLGEDHQAVVELQDYKREKWQQVVFRSTFWEENVITGKGGEATPSQS